jgi:hypothetical protein
MYIDLVRDGVADLGDAVAKEYDRQVYRALVRVAMSARQAGYDYARWSYLLDESTSRLGLQARRAGGRRERTPHSYHQLLAKAWDTAARVIAERPARTAEQVVEHLARLRLYVVEAGDLTVGEREVLGAAVTLGEKHGTLRPALPWRALAEVSGRTERQTKTALAGLQRKGLLTLARRGRASASGGRANLYHLPGLDRLLQGAHTSPDYVTYGTPAARQGPDSGGLPALATAELLEILTNRVATQVIAAVEAHLSGRLPL